MWRTATPAGMRVCRTSDLLLDRMGVASITIAAGPLERRCGAPAEPRCRARLSGAEIGFIGSCCCEIAQGFDQRVCPGGARPEATTRYIAELGSRPCRSNRHITLQTPPPC